jgi:hypothetical protein
MYPFIDSYRLVLLQAVKYVTPSRNFLEKYVSRAEKWRETNRRQKLGVTHGGSTETANGITAGLNK